jgi:hypothetical protein
MDYKHTIWFILLSAILLIYVIYTLRFFVVFRKDVFFTRKVKLLHLILIWLIPFVWIFILKSLTKPTPGSYEEKIKEEPIPFSDNDRDANRAAGMGF